MNNKSKLVVIQPIVCENVRIIAQDIDGNEYLQEILEVRNSVLLQATQYVIPYRTHPAPALPADLREELLEALRIGEKAKLEQLNLIPASGPKSYEIFALKYSLDQIRAAITKLTNLG